MKRHLFLSIAVVFLIGCTSDLQAEYPTPSSTQPVSQASPTENTAPWSVYDPDPDHLWNRVFRQLYQRTTVDGKEYGANELDPLLWFDTTYLLNGPSHGGALRVLDEFLSSRAEGLIRDPLKRAMFQRDLWAVFDWSASQTGPYPSERQALEARLAQIIRRVALSREEIVSLPNNYSLEVGSHTFPAAWSAGQPDAAFLPPDIFQIDSAWVPIGREGGPAAMTHTEAFPFFGRSVFLVFVRSPKGRDATLNFIDALNTEENPVTAIGSDVALVRRMVLIDKQGDLVFSPLVETIQIRHFSPAQSFHEFELDRRSLLAGLASSLSLNRDFFMLFMSHGDVFENPDIPELQVAIPEICKACHFEYPPIPDSGNTRSIISFSRQPFSLPDHSRPMLFPTTPDKQAETVKSWKRNHGTWKSLQAVWNQTNP